MIATV